MVYRGEVDLLRLTLFQGGKVIDDTASTGCPLSSWENLTPANVLRRIEVADNYFLDFSYADGHGFRCTRNARFELRGGHLWAIREEEEWEFRNIGPRVRFHGEEEG